jgi:hypothetical protein
LQKRQDKVAALRVFDALGPDDAIAAASIVSELNDALRKPDVLALLARTGTEFGTPQDHA